MNFLKKSVIAIIGMSLMMTASLFAQDYLDNALYVKFKETSSVSAKKFQRDVVPIEYLQLKLSDKKMVQNGFHREAYSLSLFDDSFLDRTFKICFDSTVNINKIIRLLENDPNVELVERVPVFKLFSANPAKTVPNDPYYPPFDGKELLWYLKMVNAEGAWALQQGDSNIKVAVVDGAVWGEHPDLKIPAKFQYDALKKQVGDSKPPYGQQNTQCSTLYAQPNGSDPCPPYSWSHGTHCAGVVGAKNNNDIGISSLAGGVTLMGVRATSIQYPDAVVDGYEGIRWGLQNGAKVISCSWGGGNNSSTGHAILRAAYTNNVTVVAAAGNDNTDDVREPASSMYVLTVGSVDENKGKSSFSNYGNWVDILAPGGTGLTSNGGVGIISSTFCLSQSLRLYKNIHEFDDKYYDEMSGTSMATPLVASLCALMLSKDSTLTPAQIKDILQNTAQVTFSAAFMPLAGIIDAEAALKAIDTYRFDAPVENLQATNTLLDTTWLAWDAPVGNTHEILGYRVFCNGEIVDSCTTATTAKVYPVPSGQNVFLVSVLYKDGFVSTRKEVRSVTPAIYTVSVTIKPSEGGTVTGTGRYAANTLVTLTAIPNEGYDFVEWINLSDPDFVETLPRTTFRISSDLNYGATFKKTVANEQTEGLSFSLTPNPAREQVKISSPALINRISVVDLQGRTVKQLDNVNAAEYTLDVQDLENGTYVISLQTQSGKLQQKFVKL